VVWVAAARMVAAAAAAWAEVEAPPSSPVDLVHTMGSRHRQQEVARNRTKRARGWNNMLDHDYIIFVQSTAAHRTLC
jgi:hypothetical protein